MGIPIDQKAVYSEIKFKFKQLTPISLSESSGSEINFRNDSESNNRSDRDGMTQQQQ